MPVGLGDIAAQKKPVGGAAPGVAEAEGAAPGGASSGSAAGAGGVGGPAAAAPLFAGPPRKRPNNPGDRNNNRLPAIGDPKIPKELKVVLTYLMMASTSVMAETRMLTGVLLDVVIFPAASALNSALAATGKQYAEMCEAAGRGHEYGPPHIHLWRTLVEHLSLNQAIGQATRTCLAAHLVELTRWSMEEACLHIRLIKVTRTFKSETRKLWLHVNESIRQAESANPLPSIRRNVLNALGELDGFRLVQGRAPPGHLETELSAFLEKLNAQ